MRFKIGPNTLPLLIPTRRG
uniref:Uncharacterized protein n=1 Tax=Anguilla anguilla TaxID=7936 RepID=A0A0E9TXP9_ANGAN